MTLEELWKIKDKISNEIKDMTPDEVVAYFAKSKDEFNKYRAERKKALIEKQNHPVNHPA